MKSRQNIRCLQNKVYAKTDKPILVTFQNQISLQLKPIQQSIICILQKQPEPSKTSIIEDIYKLQE